MIPDTRALKPIFTTLLRPLVEARPSCLRGNGGGDFIEPKVEHDSGNLALIYHPRNGHFPDMHREIFPFPGKPNNQRPHFDREGVSFPYSYPVSLSL
jgi:hypothetical protein